MLEIATLLGVDLIWLKLVIGLLIMLGVVNSFYPWKAKWKSKEIQEKDGTKVTKYYFLDE